MPDVDGAGSAVIDIGASGAGDGQTSLVGSARIVFAGGPDSASAAYGEVAYGDGAYGDSEVGEIPPFQNRNVFAEISIVADGIGASIDPSIGVAEFGFFASGVGASRLTKVKVIQTVPRSGRGTTRLSHTGQN